MGGGGRDSICRRQSVWIPARGNTSLWIYMNWSTTADWHFASKETDQVRHRLLLIAQPSLSLVLWATTEWAGYFCGVLTIPRAYTNNGNEPMRAVLVLHTYMLDLGSLPHSTWIINFFSFRECMGWWISINWRCTELRESKKNLLHASTNRRDIITLGGITTCRPGHIRRTIYLICTTATSRYIHVRTVYGA